MQHITEIEKVALASPSKESFLIEEYRSAQRLTYHVDEQRVSLTKYYFAVVGVLLAIFAALGKGELDSAFINAQVLVPLVSATVWIVSLNVVMILARLRRVQLEHFRIILNIRKYFLPSNDYLSWNAVQLSEKTMPAPTLYSGTFLWTLLIVVIGSFALPIALGSVTVLGTSSFNDVAYVLLYLISAGIKYALYMRLARPEHQEVYDDTNLPYENTYNS